MKPVGIVSIPRSQTPTVARSFANVMGTAGHNTGNLLFTHAVWQQIDGPKQRIGYNFDPEKLNRTLRALVFPAANWFGAHVDFSSLADLVERLDIPVVMIGLGTQDSGYSGDVTVPEGTVRFVRAVAQRSRSISVRGLYTTEVLKRHGIEKITVTGCPSLYQQQRSNADLRLLKATRAPPENILIHSTRYAANYRPFIDTPSLHRELFRLAYRCRLDLLFQSEPEEISLLIEASQKPVIDKALETSMLDIYQAGDWPSLEAYLRAHGKVFFDIRSWRNGISHYDRAFGTRLHATIMALNSGIPSVLAHHDSRTREMCEFAGIPSVAADVALADRDKILDVIAAADFRHFIETRDNNMKKYQQFLVDNSLSPAVALKD
jgi:hypothetical protein